MKQHVRLVDGDEIEVPEFIVDVAGHRMDLRSPKWRLNAAATNRTMINWTRVEGCDEDAIAALRVHLVQLIETNSSNHAYNAFSTISDFLRALRDDSSAPLKVVALASLTWYLERLRAKRSGYLFHHIRQWYTACADRYIAGFDDEVVFALGDLRIEGNAKGFAVLSADPESGPLSEIEEAALRQALLRDDGPIEQRAALWLAFAFGTNPANLALLREEDFTAVHFPDGTPSAYFLNMPRIKKRQNPRTEFKKRYVDNPLAAIIQQLIDRNAKLVRDSNVRPLFRLTTPRRKLVGGPLEAYTYHPTGGMITALIAQYVERLNVVSPRTGRPLAVTTRRLRYTFARKMVRLGTAARELAELLDHTDTQQVHVYYKADSRFVERLNATIAEHLGPTVRAFMGEIVDRDMRTKDIIPFRDLPDLGQCGASFICGLSAPKNCYGCRKFNAFKDGAHEAVLKSLLAERNDLLESGNERIAQQLDMTILAVGEVVARTRGSAL